MDRNIYGHGHGDGTGARRGIGACMVALGLLAALAIFFRLQISNGWTLLFGDRTDGAIMVTILEHWFNVFAGHAEWNMLFYFFPHDNTLGYNDGYFLYGVIYAVFRFCGLDMFLATELVNVTVKAIGFLSFYAFMRSALPVPRLLAVTGALRRDAELGREQALVMPLPRAEHHAMLAEGHGLLVAIGGDVPDREGGHQDARRMRMSRLRSGAGVRCRPASAAPSWAGRSSGRRGRRW